MPSPKVLIAYGLAGLAFVAASLVGYAQFVFAKHRQEIDGALAATAPINRNPPDAVRAMLGGGALASTADDVGAHFLMRSYPTALEAPTVQALDRFLWSRLVRYYYSESEIVGLYCAVSSLNNGATGLDAAARSLWGEPADALDRDRLAYVLAALRSPSLAGDPDALRPIADRLLESARAR
ncbi:MAG: hypothetical protein AAGM22_26980 [Acidobacteriota bacterium]